MTPPWEAIEAPTDQKIPPVQPVSPILELSDAQFIALAETDREAALKLLWPDAEDATAMRFLDEIIFDGFLQSLKE